MKKIFFFPLIGVLLFSVILAGCSKDEQLNRPDASKAYYKTADVPEILYGSMKGYLEPVPSYASIQVKGDMGYAMEKAVAADGSFWLDRLPSGNYYIRIMYVVRNAGYSYMAYHEIERVKVVGGEITEMGAIKLPWSF